MRIYFRRASVLSEKDSCFSDHIAFWPYHVHDYGQGHPLQRILLLDSELIKLNDAILTIQNAFPDKLISLIFHSPINLLDFSHCGMISSLIGEVIEEG